MVMDQLETQNSGSPLSFKFSGTEAEYFPIWIVNVLLTILTLGIYSPWAKVRTKQYFYGSTYLDGASFRYLADPKKILKGRLIAFGAFVSYYIASMFSPFAALVIMIIIISFAPALMVLSMSFSLRNSAFRNVVFRFKNDFKRVYKLFAILILLVSACIALIILVNSEEIVSQFSIGNSEEITRLRSPIGFFIFLSIFAIILLAPWGEFLITQFRVENTYFGDAQLKFSGEINDYYLMYIEFFYSFVFWAILISALGASMSFLLGGAGRECKPSCPSIFTYGSLGPSIFMDFGIFPY